VCNSSCLEIWRCLILRKIIYQLVVRQVPYRRDLQCSQVCQASNSTPLCTWGTWGSLRWSNLPELQRVSDRAGILTRFNFQACIPFTQLRNSQGKCGEQREEPSGIATCSLGQSHNLSTSLTFQLWMFLLFGLISAASYPSSIDLQVILRE